MSVRKTIAHNTAYNAGGRLWEAIVSVGLTVYIIDVIGLESFGLWSLVAVFTGYAALFDFGVSSAFTKYIASFAGESRNREVSAVVSTGVAFYGALGLLMLAVGWPLIDLLLEGAIALMSVISQGASWGGEGNAHFDDARFLCRGALLIFAVTNCMAPFAAMQSGLQRMGITNALSVAASFLKVGATVYFLESGYGVRGLLYTNALVLAGFVVANIVVAYRIFPDLRCRPSSLRWPIFRTLLAFGWRSQVAKLSNLINFQTDRMIVALVTGGQLELVGLYRIGEDIAAKVRQVPTLVVSALVPAASDLDARNDHERLAQLYVRSTKYVAALTIPLTAFAIATTDLLLSLYQVKSELAVSGWVARIILLGYAMNLLPGPGVSIALGKGRAGLPMKAGLISMIGNVILTLILFNLIGFYGIPLATALALSVSTLWFFSALKREVDVSPWQLLRQSCSMPLVASLPGFLCCLAITWVATPYLDRIGNLAIATGCALLFGLTYVAFLRWTPFMDSYDVSFLRDTLRLDRVPGFRFLTSRAQNDS
jgi:O-antigen/teichoic acid export membrane protein